MGIEQGRSLAKASVAVSTWNIDKRRGMGHSPGYRPLPRGEADQPSQTCSNAFVVNTQHCRPKTEIERATFAVYVGRLAQKLLSSLGCYLINLALHRDCAEGHP